MRKAAFDDGRFAHSGFTDEQRVVLLSARKDLADPLDLPSATHHRIQFVFTGALGQVTSEIVQHRGLALGGAGIAFPHGSLRREGRVVVLLVVRIIG